MQAGAYSLHRKTDPVFFSIKSDKQQVIKCDDVLRVERSSSVLRGQRSQNAFNGSLFNAACPASEPAATSREEIRLCSRRVEDVKGKNEEKGWRLSFKQKRTF